MERSPDKNPPSIKVSIFHQQHILTSSELPVKYARPVPPQKHHTAVPDSSRGSSVLEQHIYISVYTTYHQCSLLRLITKLYIPWLLKLLNIVSFRFFTKLNIFPDISISTLFFSWYTSIFTQCIKYASFPFQCQVIVGKVQIWEHLEFWIGNAHSRLP